MPCRMFSHSKILFFAPLLFVISIPTYFLNLIILVIKTNPQGNKFKMTVLGCMSSLLVLLKV